MTIPQAGLAAAAIVALALLAAGCGSSSSSNGTGSGSGSGGSSSGKTIHYGYVDWSEDVVNTMLAKALLQKAGYNVQTQMADAGPVFTGLSTGSLNVFSEAWLPHTHAAYWRQYGSKLVKLGRVYTGSASTGLAVPDYCNTKSYTDLNAQQSMYGGKIIGIDPGAGEMATTKQAIQAYGLDYTLLPGSEAAMEASLKKAYAAKQCVVVPLWQPLWVWSVYKMHYLQDPKGIYKPDHVYVVAPKSFPSQFPGVAKFFSHYQLPLSDVDSMMLAVEKGGNASTVAQQWMSKHSAMVSKWVAMAES